jgi:hypothetical protein
MEDHMQYIDDFFQGKLSNEETKVFEEKISGDPSFAANVAFYISSRQSAKEIVVEEKKKRYRELYSASNGQRHTEARGKVRRLWYAAIPAMVAAMVILFISILKEPSQPISPTGISIKIKYHPQWE